MPNQTALLWSAGERETERVREREISEAAPAGLRLTHRVRAVSQNFAVSDPPFITLVNPPPRKKKKKSVV